MLHHLFVYVNKLLLIDKVAYSCYQEAFTACCQHYSYLEDYYTNLETDLDKLLNNNKDKEDLKVKPELEDKRPFADFKAYAQQQLDNQS